MTPALPRRRSFGLPTSVALFTLLLGLAGSSSSESSSVSGRVFPLGLDRLFPELASLTAVPEEPAAEPPASLIEPAEPTAESLRQSREVSDRYLLALPFGGEIRRVAAEHRVDGLLVASVVEAESSFRADAVSPKGALGLMQLMPVHFDGIAEPLDPAVNLDLGTGYLAGLEKRYAGDLTLALAAYHAGPGAVDRWGGVPPYSSTRHYVGRVLTLYREHQESLERTLAGSRAPGESAAVQRGS